VSEVRMYRKKPVVIAARQVLDHTPGELSAIARWCGGSLDVFASEGWVIAIPTLEGTMHASHGDWIIRGVKGEFYPCKPDIFEATYEPAAAQPSAEEGDDG
jgi:hypothetical protein